MNFFQVSVRVFTIVLQRLSHITLKVACFVRVFV